VTAAAGERMAAAVIAAGAPAPLRGRKALISFSGKVGGFLRRG
jgi:hypothetical protein